MKLVHFRGSEDQPVPCRGADHQGGDVWLVPSDSVALEEGAAELTGIDAREAVPERPDLPADHPLRGKRALKAVPAGSGDIVVDDEGRLFLAGEVDPTEEPR